MIKERFIPKPKKETYKVCDKCEHEIHQYSYKIQITPEMGGLAAGIFSPVNNFELCEDCLKTLMTWRSFKRVKTTEENN
jgi:hypothetical protein